MGRSFERAVIRTIDVVIAAAVLVFFLPLLAVCTAGIWLGKGRPVLARERRRGADGRTFAQLGFIKVNNRANRWKLPAPPVSNFLTASGLDGLPPLWNVVKGDLSLVGPPTQAAERPQDGAAAKPDSPIRSGLMQPSETHPRPLSLSGYLAALGSGVAAIVLPVDDSY